MIYTGTMLEIHQKLIKEDKKIIKSKIIEVIDGQEKERTEYHPLNDFLVKVIGEGNYTFDFDKQENGVAKYKLTIKDEPKPEPKPKATPKPVETPKPE